MKDTYKSYYKKNIITPVVTVSPSTTTCQTTPPPSTDILSIYNVKHYNGKYDYSKVSKKIVDAATATTPQDNQIIIVDKLSHPHIVLSYPWDDDGSPHYILGENVFENLGTYTTTTTPFKINLISDTFNTLNYSKKIYTTDPDFLNNWYDFFTIPDYNIGNKYSGSSSNIYNYCSIGYIPSSNNDDKMIERNITENGSYKNMFFYSPFALILLFGTSKSDLLNLYNKYKEKQWNDIYEKQYNDTSTNIEYELIIDNIDINNEKDAYINKIFDEKNSFIDNLFDKYAYNLTYKNIEPLYDKYYNNIYEKDIDVIFYEKAFEIALKISNYNDNDIEDKFYISMKKIHESNKKRNIVDIINIITISSYYCFGKITEKNPNLNRIYKNYNNYCLNKLNSNYININQPIKSIIDIDISKLSDKNTKIRKENNIINTISQFRVSDQNTYNPISNLNSKLILKYDLDNEKDNFKINLLNNSFFKSIQSYIKFFIFFVITNLIIYLSYYLIQGNWISFINVVNTLIFGLIIIISSIIDYFRYWIWKPPYTKRNVLYIHKTSLNLEYEINLLKRKYENFINSKENKGGDMIENIILGLAFFFIIRIIIEVIIDVSKLFKKNFKKNINPYYTNSDENIIKLRMYNNDSWWNYKNTIPEDLINEIKLQLIFNQYIKLENEIKDKLKDKLSDEFSFNLVCTINLKETRIDILFNFKFPEDKLTESQEVWVKNLNVIGLTPGDMVAGNAESKYFNKKTFMEINWIQTNNIIKNIIENIDSIFLISEKNYMDFYNISNEQQSDPSETPPTFISNGKFVIEENKKIIFITDVIK